MLVVIFILGVLSTIMVVSLRNAREKAMIAKVSVELNQIFNALLIMEDDTKQWPGHKVPYRVELATGNEICDDGCAYSLSDCRAGLLCDDPGTPYQRWDGPYLKGAPSDPWGNEYFFDTDYNIDGDMYAVIGSYGPDGTGNNEYNSDDILFELAK